MDETSICLHQGDVRGTIFVSRKRQREEVVQRVTRGKRRRCLTFVAFICDQPLLQHRLPQILILNGATVPLRLVGGLRAAAPRNVTIIRQTSAWNNDRVCAYIVGLLALALEPYMEEYQPLLIMDAVRVHTTARVVAACRARFVWPVIIPPPLTWLLQPLDTRALGPFKRALHTSYQAARARAAGSDLGIEAFLDCVYDAMRVLADHHWANAFDASGFGHRQSLTSKTLLSRLGIDRCDLPLSMPAYQDFQTCFPRRSREPCIRLWRFIQRGLPVRPCAAASISVEQAAGEIVAVTASSSADGRVAHARDEHNDLGRTRSRTRAMITYPRGRPLTPRRRSGR